jgi:DNA polymerase III sliding clamp (beta) subunit (PCNA family)
MKVNKKQFEEALSIVKPGLARKELIEQSTTFAFVDGRVVTYNDEISISHPVTGLTLSGAVEAEQFIKFLGKIKLDEVEFDIRDNQIVIASGRSRAGLSLQTNVSLPLEEELGKKSEWKEVNEKFTEALTFAIGSCSKDMSQPLLTCIHVNKEGIIESSDSYRITRYTLSSVLPVRTFLLPATSAEEVVKLNVTHVAEGGGWMHFKNAQDTVISCRIIKDTYPNTIRHLEIKKGDRLLFPSSMEEALDRAMIFAHRSHILEEIVTITVSKGRIKLSASSDNSWFEEELNIAYEGEEITFAITPHLLKAILSKTAECVINEEKSKLKFEGEGWVYLTMLRK